MASTINKNETYTILGSTLQDICDSVSNATGSENIPIPMIPKMIDGINLRYEDIKDVMFMDYNGDLLYSWDKDDFINNVTELPPGPTWHSNLTFQEWNWDLADIKTELGKSGACCIGACYTTKDSATHFYIDIQDEADLNVTMYMARISSSVTIDWGDGNTDTATADGRKVHTYSNLGEYDVKVTNSFYITSSEFFFRRWPGSENNSGSWQYCYNNFLIRAELGTNAIISASHNNVPFVYCPRLESVSVHKDVISSSTTNLSMTAGFADDSRFRFFVFPKSLSNMASTTTNPMVNLFVGCTNLVSVSFPKGFQAVRTRILGAAGCGIKFLYLPYVSSVTTNHTSYSPLFAESSLYRFAWGFDSSNIVNTDNWYQTLYQCYNLRKISLEYMNISAPNRYFLGYAESLSGELIIPVTCTAFTGNNFSNCFNITKIVILGDITAVGVADGRVFSNCFSCLEWDFTHCTTVPTLYSTNCFDGIRPTAKIKVPAALETQWKAASNWSNYASYIVGV